MKWIAWSAGILAVTLVVALAVGFFGLGFFLSPQDKLAKVDSIVAISGGDTAARTDEAVRLYREGYAPRLIFSGAALDTSGPSNAKAMAIRAGSKGVPATDIFLDETSDDTRENADHVGQLVRDRNYGSIILVTSPYHQRRAYILFRRALPDGVLIINHSAPDQTWRRSHWWANGASLALTFDELQKVTFELLRGDK